MSWHNSLLPEDAHDVPPPADRAARKDLTFWDQSFSAPGYKYGTEEFLTGSVEVGQDGCTQND